MSYDVVKKDFVKEKFWVIELDLDTCNLVYGNAPCTAAVGVTGDQKCFNTASTCQDRANYDRGTKTYRYCTKRSPTPAGLNAIPSLKSAPTIDGAKINPAGGLGVRGGISMSFLDHPDNDTGTDPYVDERAYIPFDTGTYWGKLRARNPHYNNRAIRAFSGYLVDGIYDPANFQQRSYVIENITANRGMGTVKGKDVLKLADNNRSQYPAKSNGSLNVGIDNVETVLTLVPAGVGNDEYDASGWVRIADEVMSFTRVADVLTVVRGQYTTLANSHDIGDTVQLCKYLNDTVANIDYELLTLGAKIDPAFIDLPTWENESDSNYPYFLEALLTEPIGVQKLLKELGDEAPHFLYFDEVTQLINFKAVQQPPVNVNTINNNEHILKDSLVVSDVPSARLSDVLVYFGQRDPTKKMDELNNYAQTYIRSDLSSSSDDEYGSKQIKTILSRWVNNFNKAAAIELATRKGRRFGITPRQVAFKLTAKDSEFKLGDNIGIDHPVLQTITGETGGNIFQITSVKEAGDFNYTALEYVYSEALPDDPESGVNLIILGGNANNINLRTIYNAIFPAPDGTTIAKFTFENNVIIGSTSTAYSIETGSWPVGAEVIIQTNLGAFIVGAGGDAVTPFAIEVPIDGLPGGDAILLEHDVTLINSGVIGGGGGGSASYFEDPTLGGEAYPSGGGAGHIIGLGIFGGGDGTLELGGVGHDLFTETQGGDLGEDGADFLSASGGSAGIAINKNGHTLTIVSGGANIRGDIIA